MAVSLFKNLRRLRQALWLRTPRQQPQSSLKTVHWRVPTVMVGSLVLGTVAAVGHHILNMHYDNRPNGSLTEQRILSNAGTGFAFLVKMFLAIATGTAYVQIFWMSLKQKSYCLDRVDRLYSVLGNAVVFWDLGLWLRNPILATLAIVTWMLPLAVIVTPGTLAIQTAHQTSYAMTKPPQLTLDANQYAIYSVADNDESPMNLQGPVSSLTAVAVASAAQQVILPIAHLEPNISYHLRFNGPTLQCTEPAKSNISAFRQALTDATSSGWFGGTNIGLDTAGGSNLAYNAWAPDQNKYEDLSNPNWNNGSLINTIDTTYGKYQGGTLFIYLGHVSGFNTLSGTITILQCTLFNATYYVDFRFSGGNQEVKITDLTYHSPVNITDQIVDFDTVPPTAEDLSNPGVTYTAVMWAFNQVLIGSGTTNTDAEQPVPIYTGTLAQITALRQFIEGTGDLQFNAIKVTVEEMFQNTTVSLLNSDKFLLNMTDRQLVNTTTITSEPRYTYRPTDIYIAYGSAVLCASICTIIGCIALYLNQASYSSDFTTVIRTTRRREISELITEQDSTGADPLGKAIAKVSVTFHAPTNRTDGVVDSSEEEAKNQDERGFYGLTTVSNVRGEDPSTVDKDQSAGPRNTGTFGSDEHSNAVDDANGPSSVVSQTGSRVIGSRRDPLPGKLGHAVTL